MADLAGHKFGKLTITRRDGQGKWGAMWLATCECGNVRRVNGKEFRRGKVFSCGCSRRPGAGSVSRNRAVEYASTMVGTTFGVLKVIGVEEAKTGRARVIVRCEGCDRVYPTDCRTLVRAGAKSCRRCMWASPYTHQERHPSVSVDLARDRVSRGWSVEAACMIPKGAKTR
jgi:hypothetical protein